MAAATRPSSLLCAVGWHTARQPPRWNDGYYFSRCERCDRDLVRTAYSRWQAPRGYRVVWQARPPGGDRGEPMLRPPDPSASVELPIERVLRTLREQEEATAEPAEIEHGADPEPIADPLRSTLAASVIPDFMSDGDPDAGSPSEVASGDGIAAPSPAEEAVRPHAARRAGLPLAERWARIRGAAGRVIRGSADRIGGAARRAAARVGTARGALARTTALTGGVAAILVSLALIGWGMQTRTPQPPVPTPAPVAAAIDPSQAFVSASLLNCRSAPARQSRTVRRLARGDSVQVLGRDGEWLSLAHRGQQCWAAARFVSAVTPL